MWNTSHNQFIPCAAPSCRSEYSHRVPKQHPALKTLDFAMLRTYLLSYHNDCVIINRAHIPPKRRGRMHHTACPTKTYAPPSRPLTHNPIQPQNRSAACHSSVVTHHCQFLIASREILRIHLTPSQQTRKSFLIASFSGSLAQPSHPANPNSPIPSLLIATHPDSEIR